MSGEHLSERSVAAAAANEWTGFDPVTRARVVQHAAVCPECAAGIRELAAAHARTAELLESLDVPLPAMSATAVIARARQRSWTRSMRVAAGVAAFATAAAAAAATPSFPLHRPLARAIAALVALGSRQHGAAPGVVPAPSPEVQTQEPAQRAGIAVRPGSRMDIIFAAAQPSGVVRVVVADTGAVSLSTTDSTTAYQIGDGRIDVLNAGSRANYDIVLPRTLQHAAITIGGTVVFRRISDSTITTRAVQGDARAGYQIPLSH